MLENDIILTRYLDAVDGKMDEATLAALDRLLDLGDNELWDLLSGNKEPEGEMLQDLVRQLRNA